MLRVEKHLREGWAALVLSAPADDRDWRAYAAAIDDMNREAPERVRPVLLQQILPGVPAPSAIVRKELGELRKRIRADALNVVIVPSTLPRAAQVALDWLHKPHYETHTFGDLESGLSLIEARLGPMDRLREVAVQLRRLA